MKNTRKANLALMHVQRKKYSVAYDALWVLLVSARQDKQVSSLLVDWLNGQTTYCRLLNRISFLYSGSDIMIIKMGFNSIEKLMHIINKGN